MEKLSVIIPVLNEVGNIEELTRRIIERTEDSEIIFVDDGSDDGTRSLIQNIVSSNTQIKYIFNESRLGHMGSYLEGISKAKSDNIVIMDGDLQHPPEILPDFLFAFERGYNLVIGTRYVNHSFIGKRSLVRGLISRTADLILKLTVPQCRNISDPISGFIGFNRNLNIPVTPEMKGNKLLPFLLVSNWNLKIAYAPYRFRERVSGKSKIVSGGTSFIRKFLHEVRDIRAVAAKYNR